MPTISRRNFTSWEDCDVAFYRAIGERLRLTRKILGISEREAAGAAGVTVKTYRKWESGARQRSGFPVEWLCDEFDVSITWMFMG